MIISHSSRAHTKGCDDENRYMKRLGMRYGTDGMSCAYLLTTIFIYIYIYIYIFIYAAPKSNHGLTLRLKIAFSGILRLCTMLSSNKLDIQWKQEAGAKK